MLCSRTITHVVKPGETIYQIAKIHETTVPEILIRNQGINPYNLRVGTNLTICPEGDTQNIPDGMELNQDMRKAWVQLAYWTRMYLLSIAENLNDVNAVEERLDKVPKEMSDIFLKFYPGSVTYQLEQSWLEMVNDTAELIRAAKAEDTARANELDQKINQDVENIASLLSNMNINYDKEEIKEILQEYLVLTKRQVVARLEGQHEDDINTFDALESQALKMADYLSDGIMNQYKNNSNQM